MPKRIAVQTILLTRDGQSVRPPIGAPFDFTDAELKSIESLNPDAIKKIVAGDGPATPAALTQSEVDEQVAAAVKAALEAERAKTAEADTTESKTPAKASTKSKATSDDGDL